MLTRALAEGRDASDPAVAAAFHLEESGVLGDSTRLSTRYLDGATGQGRDFTGDADRSVVDLTETAGADGRKAAPWAGDKDRHGNDKPAPYLVRAELDPADADFLLLTVDGATWRATHAEFLELLAADPALQADELSTGVVLDIPELDRRAPGLADAAAQRLGRHVHSTAQDSGVSAIGRDGTAVLELLPAADTPDAPLTWNRSTPRWSDQTAPAPRSVPDPLPEHAPLPAEGTAAGPRPVPGIGRPVPGASAPALLPGSSVATSAGPVFTAPATGSEPRPAAARRAPATPRSATLLPFRGGALELSADERESVRKLARKSVAGALPRWKFGVRPDEVRIVGRGNGLPQDGDGRAPEAGRQRADARWRRPSAKSCGGSWPPGRSSFPRGCPR